MNYDHIFRESFVRSVIFIRRSGKLKYTRYNVRLHQLSNLRNLTAASCLIIRAGVIEGLVKSEYWNILVIGRQFPELTQQSVKF